MKNLLYSLVSLVLLFACTPGQDSPLETGETNLAPSVTVGASHISAVSAVLAGKANLGSSSASDLMIGFQYSKSAGILPSNSTTIEATDTDANYKYTASITGLEPDTKYYFRSFVRQDSQYTYGETKEFTTKEISSVLETLDATGVEATSAILNAKLDLTDVKYESIKHGFYWGTSEGSQKTFINGEAKDNAMTASMTGLNHKTQYWYKAYVKIDNQTFYGEVKTFTTDVVKVESVSLDKTKYTFNTIGNTVTLKATVLPADATDKSIEWSSDNESVATVDANGKVTSVSFGTVTIKVEAKDGSGKFATCSVTIESFVFGVVDLGLPSGLKWANANLGASSPEDYGDYYAWGVVETKEDYSWSTYKWGRSSTRLTKYNTNSANGTVDNKIVLDPEDDVAHVKLGGNWRMPSDAEWTELRTECTWTWTTQSGVKGRLVTGKNGNSIFLPAAGYRNGTYRNKAGSRGVYWSSSLRTDYPGTAWGVYFESSGVYRFYPDRYFGQSVRPVSE